MRSDMPKVVRKDIIDILVKAKVAMQLSSVNELKSLSNQTIHNASIFQDQDSVSIAVVMYAVSKLLERRGFDTTYAENLLSLMGDAQDFLKREDYQGYRSKIKDIFDFISTTDRRFKLYVDRVIDKAQIKKGSRLYEHGLSMAKSAEILGIGQWELMSYVGKTRIIDEEAVTTGVKKRLDVARKIFNV